MSGDSDLATTVRRVRGRFPTKRVLIGFPPRRNSDALKRVANAYIKLGEDKIRNSQLPDPVVTAGGIVLARPSTWK